VGDRFVVGFQENSDDPIVYLYSHWGGEAQEKILADALLQASGRWGDPAYGTRIVMSQIIGDDWKGSLGFGVSVNNFAYPDYPTIQVVEWHNKSVSIRDTDNPSIEVASTPLDDFVKEKV